MPACVPESEGGQSPAPAARIHRNSARAITLVAPNPARLPACLQWLGRSIEDCGEAMCVPVFDTGRYKPGFHDVNQDGEPAAVTAGHTPEAREFIAKHTAEVLARCPPIPGKAAAAGAAAAASAAAAAAPAATGGAGTGGGMS